jgi:hypothetical protein
MNYWIRFATLVALATLLTRFTDGFIFLNSKKHPVIPSLQLRNSNNLAVCNDKYVYMKYLIGIRNFKRVYRIIKDNHLADIQNAINILNILNYLNNTHLSHMPMNNNNPNMNMDSDTIYININNTAKNLILSNIYIDVSTIKYIQISTKNDTLIVELDKNNMNMNTQNMMYDISKIDNLLSSISLLMKLVNIN